MRFNFCCGELVRGGTETSERLAGKFLDQISASVSFTYPNAPD
jgi:hypothetical protein